MPPANTPSPVKPKNEPVGPTVGIVIIVLLLLLGALYFWGKQLNTENDNAPTYVPSTEVSEPDVSIQASTTLP